MTKFLKALVWTGFLFITALVFVLFQYATGMTYIGAIPSMIIFGVGWKIKDVLIKKIEKSSEINEFKSKLTEEMIKKGFNAKPNLPERLCYEVVTLPLKFSEKQVSSKEEAKNIAYFDIAAFYMIFTDRMLSSQSNMKESIVKEYRDKCLICFNYACSYFYVPENISDIFDNRVQFYKKIMKYSDRNDISLKLSEILYNDLSKNKYVYTEYSEDFLNGIPDVYFMMACSAHDDIRKALSKYDLH